MSQLLSRRDVIKTFLVTSACSLVENKLWAAKTVSEVAAAGIDPTLGIARIDLATFPPLANDGGSVRLGSSGFTRDADGKPTGPVGLYYPILINRISASEYVVVNSQCTHAGYVVPPYAFAEGTNALGGRITCPHLGSQYDIRGKVQPGFDAKSDLLNYPTSLNNNILSVSLFDFGFHISQKLVLNNTEKRLEIEFESYEGTEYEVRYRPNMAAIPTLVSFSDTINGPFTKTFIAATADNRDPNTATNKVWVLPQDGLFQVAIRTRVV